MLRFAFPIALCITVMTLTMPAQTSTKTSAAAANLVGNAGFEDSGKPPLPGWEELVIGAPAEFAVDTTEKHGGR